MRKRDLRLEKYGISKNRYDELQAFARQYPEWREELEHKQDTVGSPNIDGMPKGTKLSDATGSLATRRTMLSRKCSVVEEALEEAGGDLMMYLFYGVCQGDSFENMKMTLGIPCERDTYYDIRRYFFYILDEKVEKMHY